MWWVNYKKAAQSSFTSQRASRDQWSGTYGLMGGRSSHIMGRPVSTYGWMVLLSYISRQCSSWGSFGFISSWSIYIELGQKIFPSKFMANSSNINVKSHYRVCLTYVLRHSYKGNSFWLVWTCYEHQIWKWWFFQIQPAINIYIATLCMLPVTSITVVF